MTMPRHTALANSRPSWIYWSLAFGFGPLIAATLVWPWLADLSTLLVARLIGQPVSSTETLPVRLAVHMAMPTLALFLALRLSGLGRWLAISKLALTFVLLANAVFLANVALMINEYAFGTDFSLRLSLGPAMGAAATALTSLGAAAVVLTTFWYRWVLTSPTRLRKCRMLMVDM